ncbi:hypothetical protein PCANC_28035 [Puccinia coronata f. sp. avenae]|uniref:DNA 3'-5' helicase n=1 Tax=Puccinia coronata f. sp. avenae TaxID=200324 RepID=A0A2N5TCH9_9BASI|nr:hypothetical protein PCANC_28035 [Puccinia coronata f. sp. avenae]
MPQKKMKQGNQATLAQRILNLDDYDLAKTIANDARACYPIDQPLKSLQIEAVMHLVRLKNTFVMAGTGFGKSRVPELYVHLFVKSSKPVVLVLNPLDALGDNQVREKIAQKFTAINLKKLTFNRRVADEVLRGTYNFVYLSPKIFLNNEMFTELYFNTKFQGRLVLNVVNEAHMIYSWGLVASGKAKKSSAHKQHQDKALFGTPMGIWVAATCRPLVVKAILKCLQIPEENMRFVHAELTRPEIRILRFAMGHSLKSTHDLLEMFGPQDDTPNECLPPTLANLIPIAP